MGLDSHGNLGPRRQLIALVFDGAVRVVDVAPPASETEALVRVRLAGVCNTDLEIIRGYKGFRGILGHEFVGEVVRAENHQLAGQRVCGEINVGCGHCPTCRAGMPGHCPDRTVVGILNRNGAFADLLCLPEGNLYLIPDSLSDEQAVFVEPVAAAFEILEQVSVDGNDRVVVLGDGKLGLLCAQVLATVGAHVELAGHHEEREQIVARHGVRWIHAQDVAPGADIVVDATGSASGFQRAVAIVRPRGTLVLKSTIAEPAPVDLNSLVVREIVVVGSRCGPFPRAIEALRRHEIDVEPLIAARYPLIAGVEAMHHASQPGVLKVLLQPGNAYSEAGASS